MNCRDYSAGWKRTEGEMIVELLTQVQRDEY